MIAWLLAKIAALEAKLAAKNIEIRKLKRLINRFAIQCRTAAERSAAEMDAGNVPQGRYGFLRGMNDLANDLLRLLGQPEQRPGKRGTGLFKGMFKW